MPKRVTTAIITAAGFGTRFLPVVKNIPKEMLPIIDKPALQLVVEECVTAGFEKIIIVVREGNDVVENYFLKDAPHVRELLESVDKGERYKPVELMQEYKDRIVVVYQDETFPYGNGSPVLSAKSEVAEGEPVAVLFADDLVFTDQISAIHQIKKFYEESDCTAVTGVQIIPHDQVNRYGIIKPKDEEVKDFGEIDYIIEKPELEEAPSNLATYGRFVVPYTIFEILEEFNVGKDNELWLQDANTVIAKRGKYMYKVVEGDWYTTGDPLRYFKALTQAYLRDPEYKEDIGKYLQSL